MKTARHSRFWLGPTALQPWYWRAHQIPPDNAINRAAPARLKPTVFYLLLCHAHAYSDAVFLRHGQLRLRISARKRKRTAGLVKHGDAAQLAHDINAGQLQWDTWRVSYTSDISFGTQDEATPASFSSAGTAEEDTPLYSTGHARG